MELETFYDQLFFTTARLAYSAGGKDWVGTGFVYGVETDAGTAHFLVSNRHVLGLAERMTITMVRAQAGEPLLGQQATVLVEDVPNRVTEHSNPLVDVAVMPMSGIFEQMDQSGEPAYFRSVPASLTLSTRDAALLDSVVDVAFVGYPNGLFDTTNFLPIVRRGTTATPIRVDYCGAPAFLVDASIFPGSSGSPVFLTEQGIAFRRGQGFSIGGVNQKLLGVIAAVHTRSLTGEIAEVTTALSVSIAEPIDLGIVYKAHVIDECIDAVLQSHGLTRLAAELSEPGSPTEADAKL